MKKKLGGFCILLSFAVLIGALIFAEGWRVVLAALSLVVVFGGLIALGVDLMEES